MMSGVISLIVTSLSATHHFGAPDGAPGDIFGSAVGLDGTHLLAGAPSHAEFGYLAGAVYAFEHDGETWSIAQEIAPPVTEPYGEFGYAVDLQGDLAAIGWIGGMEADNRVGKVVLYEWTGLQWTQVQILTDPDAEHGDRFGASVLLDGDQLIVGCQLDDEAGWNAGSALIYRRVNGVWTFEQRLLPSQASEFSWAGRDVALDGDIAVVGAYFEWEGDLQAAGAAYVYHRSSDGVWTEEARLTADDPHAGDYFGFSLSLEGERLAVGSILSDAPFEDSGAVYLFDRDGGTWTQSKLDPPDQGGEFGYSVVLRGEDLLVGTVYHPGTGLASGAVHRFGAQDGAWQWQGKWLPRQDADGGFFGAAIHVDGERAAVGAPRENTAGQWSGAVYVRELGGACPCDLDGNIAIDVVDLLAVIDAWGVCTACPEDIDGDGFVGANDILAVLALWGWCP